MTQRYSRAPRVAAVFPTTWGFGYAIFEGPDRLLDWGVKAIPNKERSKHLVRLRTMLDWYEPRALVLENFAGKGSRKGKRTSSVIISMVRIATRQGVRVEGFSRERIREAFEGAGARTKHEIATAIAQKFPELSPRMPRRRQPWMNEHYSMAVFDAVALALTYFHFRDRSDKPA